MIHFQVNYSLAVAEAMKLMKLEGMPETEQNTRTPRVSRPKMADLVELGLALTPPPIVNQQSEPCRNLER